MSEPANRKLYYSHNLNPRVAVAVARHLDSPVDYVRAEPEGVDKPWFRAINPNTRVPVLVEDDRALWETDAIAFALARLSGTDFWPLDHPEEMLMWASWSAHHFTAAGSTLYFEHIIVPQFIHRPPNDALLAEAMADFRRFAAVLDQRLEGRDWLIDGRPTYADFRVASALPFTEGAKLPVSEFRNIELWHDRLMQFDAWREPFAGLA